MTNTEREQLLDLMARMLTCATAITSAHAGGDPWDTDRIAKDACSLLIAGAAALERLLPPPEQGEPMELIAPLVAPQGMPQTNGGFTDPGVAEQRERYRSAHACPKCDSRAIKTVRRNGGSINLICPACTASWAWEPVGEARWV